MPLLFAPTMTYWPGSIVPESGIYAVIHGRLHVGNHEITAIKGERLPPCPECGHAIRYRLVRPAKHLSEHPALAQHASAAACLPAAM